MRSFAEHLERAHGDGRADATTRTPAPPAAPPCGDLVRIAVRIEGDRVAEAGFDADGCGALTAAGERRRGAASRASRSSTPARVNADDDRGRARRPEPAEAPRRRAGRRRAAPRARAPPPRTAPSRLAPSARRTLVAMSGGVDCAAAAQLALDAGDEVVAVTLELWSDPGTDGEKSCCSPQAVTRRPRARPPHGHPAHHARPARARSAPRSWTTSSTSYAAGRTPNPCVRCNGLVRFDAMLELADALGAARLATGHYARIARDERRPAAPCRRRPAQGPELHARQARPGAARAALVPARRARRRPPCARSRARPACRWPTSARARTSASSPASAAARFLAAPRRPAAAPAGRDRRPRRPRARPPRGPARLHGRPAPRPRRRSAREPLYVARQGRRSEPRDGRPARGARHHAGARSRTPRCTAPPSEVDRVRLRYHAEPLAVPGARSSDDGRLELELDRARRRPSHPGSWPA